MGADIYAMVKAGMASRAATTPSRRGGFCEEEGATLTENADGSGHLRRDRRKATFADLKIDDGDDGAKFDRRVARASCKVVVHDRGHEGRARHRRPGRRDQGDDASSSSRATSITIRIRARRSSRPTWTQSPTDKSAEIVIPFLDLINGTAELPDELYAVVKTELMR